MSDNIYYNITIRHNPNNPVAIYSEQLNQPILTNAQDYYLTTVNFSIPGQSIPVFIPEIQAYPNTNINNTIYSVTLQYNTVASSQTYVQYVSPNQLSSQGMPLTITHPFVDNTDYFELYAYSQFIAMINTTLQTAFTQLASLTTLPVGSTAPYFILNPLTHRISFISQAANYGRSLSPPNSMNANYPFDQFNNKIQVWLNTPLATLVSGIPFQYNPIGINGKNGLIDVVNQEDTNYYNDPTQVPATPPTLPTYLIMNQEYGSLANWNCLKKIILTTSLLPVTNELVPNINIGTGNLASYPIMADFIPLINEGPEARTSIDYVAQGQWRLIDLSGTGILSKIDLQVYWLDNFGRLKLLEIDYGQQVNLKLLFQKKSLTK